MTFCTLFNANYLDKGIALYESLRNVCKSDFKLYVLAMDDKCFQILKDFNKDNLCPINLIDFETQELLNIKKYRSAAEYCWTCTPSLIKHIIINYNPDYCTYLDADMYFYSNPYSIIEEMRERNATVQITGHRFYPDEFESKSKIVGKYCVEFNTFKNEENSLMLLNIWIEQCIQHCSIDGDGIYWGDQKYMDNWVDNYDFVIETNNLGAGVAPWNIAQYSLFYNDNNSVKLICNGIICELMFYHFQGIKYIEEKTINISVYGRRGIDDKLVQLLYNNYLLTIDANKRFLQDKYGLNVLITHHPGIKRIQTKSLWKRFSQKSYNFSYIINGFQYYLKYLFGDKYNISAKKSSKKNIIILH